MASIKDSIDYIFDTLCESGGGSASRSKMKPAPPPREEFECFKRLRFTKSESVSILNGITVIHFQENITELDGSVRLIDYFAIKNILPSEFKSELCDTYFSLVDLSESFFVFLCPILNLRVKKDISSDFISDELLFQQNDPLYPGHNLNELINYFEPVTIFRLEDLSTNFDKSFRSCAYYIVSSCERLITLPLAEVTISKLKGLFVANEKMPKDNIYLSLTSSHLKHCFLELYRCIEWLYVIPRSRKLKGAIEYSKPAYELAVHCVDNLSWRRKEEDSLSKLISDILKHNESVSFKLLGCNFFKDIPPDVDNIAKHLYSFRNQFVHQFASVKEKDVSEEDLVDAIDLISDIIIHAYALYDVDIVVWAEN
ncbi:HEPN domain-containing protein [Serratia marcescens]|uniref:HEPN domain-containing protein n=1 Tax=Serratia marcescens TaxID=615 RepID=UPI003F5CEF8D